jgi:hypothetical protein
VRAFFEARIEHLSIHDRVRVDCLGKMPDGSRCNRVSLIAVQGVARRSGWEGGDNLDENPGVAAW